jgi:hypothetical protein
MLRPYSGFRGILAGERKNQEVTFAGSNNGEEAAVGRNGEIAEGEAMKDGAGQRL